MKHSTPQLLKFKQFQRELSAPLFKAIGILETLWNYANATGQYQFESAGDIEAIIEWDGEAGACSDALIKHGWIDQIDGRYEIHDYIENAPEFVKQRDRQRKYRERKRDEAASQDITRYVAVTSPLCNSYETVTDSYERVMDSYERVMDSNAKPNLTKPNQTKDIYIKEENNLLCPEIAEPTQSPCAFPSEPETTHTKNQPDELFEKEQPALSFPCDGGGFYELSSHQIEQYQSAYPAIQVDSTLEQALYWILANPRRRKTKAGYPRFIIGWLNTAQNGFKQKQPKTTVQESTVLTSNIPEVPF